MSDKSRPDSVPGDPGSSNGSSPHLTLPAPLVRQTGPFQPGVTDPVWPRNPPAAIIAAGAAAVDIYASRYAGQVERQRHLHIVTLDIAAQTLEALRESLIALTTFARHQMAKRPPTSHDRPYDPLVQNRRVSVTIGFGATLFTTVNGDDRFGLAAGKPTWLKVMRSTEGDDSRFCPRDHVSDLVVLVASDDVYVNEYIFGRLYYRSVHPGLVVRTVERGYARPDSREPSGFEDGLTNPRDLSTRDRERSMHELVYVRADDDEPAWCVNGTYLAYRKIRRRMAGFFQLSAEQQTAVFGVDKTTGERVEPHSARAHSQKMNARREGVDLFGVDDLSRRFLRRPYFFNDGFDEDGEELRGLHHVSFVRNLGVQYEWPVHMWQMNEDFPEPGAGLDALYAIGGAANVGGGYYFVPGAPAAGEACVGAALFDAAR
jgi:deferrochelatase/peroxidase EfeB